MKLDKNKILRNYLNSGKLIRAVGAHDGLSAKLIGEAGFETVWASGLEISTSFGVPDANILTMTQFLSRAAQMNQSTSLPIIADCDTGFGNVNNAIHMAEQYESHGISAVCIEDKQFPKVNSFIKGRQDLADISEFVGKIKAIKNTQKDKNLILISRIEALIAGWGMEEALKRGFSYADAGSDAILIHSKNNTPKEIFEFCDSWNGKIPLVVVPTTYGSVTIDELITHNIKMVIYANQTLRIAHKSMLMILNKLKKANSLDEVNGEISSMEEIFELQKMFDMKLQEKDIEEKLKSMGYIT